MSNEREESCHDLHVLSSRAISTYVSFRFRFALFHSHSYQWWVYVHWNYYYGVYIERWIGRSGRLHARLGLLYLST